MKIPLTQAFVLDKLSIEVKPEFAPNGKLVLVPNPGRKPYIVFDSDQNAPVGFGVKVGATKKTYILQRRVSIDAPRSGPDAPPSVLKSKVGNVSDFNNISAARESAKAMAQVMHTTKRNPREVAREKTAAELTLGECFARYREHLTGRAKPATQNTLSALDKAKSRLAAWNSVRVADLRSQAVLRRFDEIASATRTAAEQTFRWASVAIKHAIALESIDAANQNRPATLTFNPMTVLQVQKKYRSRAALEEVYKKKDLRRPLSANDTLGRFLNALLDRRDENRTGCDYLILTTLWGTRKSEAAGLVWRDMLTPAEEQITPWVDLDERKVFFPDTKNRTDHALPISDAAYKLLCQRRDLQLLDQYESSPDDPIRANHLRRRFVFPARSKFSKTGHYSDARSLLHYICQAADVKRMGLHDLRRTLGRVAEELTSYAVVKRLLNHKITTDPTSRYTEVEWNRLVQVEQEIELFVLATAPRLYNILLVGKRPPLPELPAAAPAAETQTGAIRDYA